MKGINVFSCFDGIACGYEAFKKVGVKINNYFASEIDLPAIRVAHYNHPDNYTKVEGISNTQRYKMINNGWTVDVIAYFFKELRGMKA